MFRKPKRKVKQNLRKKDDKIEASEEGSRSPDVSKEEETSTSELLHQARKRTKLTSQKDDEPASSSDVMHQFEISDEQTWTNKDLATRTAQHHPTQSTTTATITGRGADGIYRADTTNKFHAGPIKAPTNIRTTCRFDYQPDICKDYKDTGFCGYGDTCIYLHDRGDTLTGWQLEQAWEEERKQKQLKQEREMMNFAKDDNEPAAVHVNTDDGLPFACFICRNHFENPVITSCSHYFCERCIMDHVRSAAGDDTSCPICGQDTHGVFNEPTKLIAKKRRLLSSRHSWEEFANLFQNNQDDTTTS